MELTVPFPLPTEVWGAGGGASTACGNSMDLKQVEVAYRAVLPSAVKAEPGVSNGHQTLNGHQPLNGHVRDWMAGGAGSPSPGAAAGPAQPNNGYSSPLSSSSYGPYSPNGKIGKRFDSDLVFCLIHKK